MSESNSISDPGEKNDLRYLEKLFNKLIYAYHKYQYINVFLRRD